jgi:hypothetical protein
MPAKRHTVASIATELAALLPTLTEQASRVLTATLLREVCGYSPDQLVTAASPVLPPDRTKVMRKARQLYL